MNKVYLKVIEEEYLIILETIDEIKELELKILKRKDSLEWGSEYKQCVIYLQDLELTKVRLEVLRDKYKEILENGENLEDSSKA